MPRRGNVNLVLMLKWNRLTLPKWVVEEAGLKEGDILMVEVKDKKIILTPAKLEPR